MYATLLSVCRSIIELTLDFPVSVVCKFHCVSICSARVIVIVLGITYQLM